MIQPRDLNGYINSAWERWGRSAFILGSLLTILGILLQVLEIARIYAGLYNYGLKNTDLSDNNQFGIVSVVNGYFLFAEPWHYWPWTYAANLIGLFVMIGGLIGILSAYRRSYSLIYTFYAFSLFSTLLPIFLIIYYSILINYYYRYSSDLVPNAQLWTPSDRPDSGDVSFGIAGTNLSLSILTVIIGLISTWVCWKAGQIGLRRKSFADFYGNEKPVVPSAFSGPYQATRF